MSNEEIRERMRLYVRVHGTAYTVIAREAGIIGSPSKYIVSRFMNGRPMKPETLEQLDIYLKERGY